MKKVVHPTLTNDYTVMHHEEDIKFNAPHHFHITDTKGNHIANFNFQEGPIKENGVNGVANEDLLVAVLVRLESFQESEFACEENEDAITSIKHALWHLRSRTTDRVIRGVEGTSEK